MSGTLTPEFWVVCPDEQVELQLSAQDPDHYPIMPFCGSELHSTTSDGNQVEWIVCTGYDDANQAPIVSCDADHIWIEGQREGRIHVQANVNDLPADLTPTTLECGNCEGQTCDDDVLPLSAVVDVSCFRSASVDRDELCLKDAMPASAVTCDGGAVNWEVVPAGPGAPTDVTVEPSSGTNVVVRSGSQSGFVTLRAKNASDPACVLEWRLKIGTGIGSGTGTATAAEQEAGRCTTCAQSNGPAGSITASVGSVDVQFHLGSRGDGRSAGRLWIHSDGPNPKLASPELLRYNNLLPASGTAELHVWPRLQGAPAYFSATPVRKLMTPEAAVEVIEETSSRYSIYFYYVSDVGSWTDGASTIGPQPGAQPFVRWIVESPNGDPERLDIKKVIGSTVQEWYSYVCTDGVHDWTLSKKTAAGQPLQSEAVTWTYDTQLSMYRHTSTTTVWDAIAQQHYVVACEETRHATMASPWLMRIVDPGGAALTTTREFYDSGSFAGRLKREVQPDGKWEWYFYSGDPTTQWTETTCRGWEEEACPSAAQPPDPDTHANRTKSQYRLWTSKASGIPRPMLSERWEYAQGHLVGHVAYVFDTAPCTGFSSCTAGCYRVTEYLYTGSASALITQRYYCEGDIVAVVHPDSRMTKYSRSYNGAAHFAFDEAAGVPQWQWGNPANIHTQWERPAADGAYVSSYSITDQNGRIVCTARTVDGGTLYGESAPFDWSVRDYDDIGRVLRVRHDNGVVESYSYESCCGLSAVDQWGPNGHIRTERDELGRVTLVVRSATPGFTHDGVAYSGQAAVTTSTVYGADADGAVVTTITSTTGLPAQTAVERYDRAGRLRSRTDAANRETRISYALTTFGSTKTVDYDPGLAQGDLQKRVEVIEHWRDGRQRSRTGSAVVEQHVAYSVEGVLPGGDYALVEKTRTGEPNSPRERMRATDWAGRVVIERRPAYNSADPIETTYEYYGMGATEEGSSPGKLKRVTNKHAGAAIEASRVLQYDALGNVWRDGLDLDGDGVLGGTTDRFTQTDTSYADDDGTLYYVTVQSRAVTGTEPLPVSTTRERKTGLWLAALRSETSLVDVAGNVSNDVVAWYSAAADPCSPVYQVRTQTDPMDGNAVTIEYGGRVVSSTTRTGRTEYQYDGFGRRTATIDPRTGPTFTKHNANGIESVYTTQDGQPNGAVATETKYEYYSSSGLRSGSGQRTDVGTYKWTRYAYTRLGQLEKTWGDVPQPTRIEYTTYGERWKLHTYRADTGWTATTWPANAGDGDVTTWTYDPATGLSTRKTDASGKYVDYRYTPDGRLYQRIWARHASSQAATTYAYDPQTGALTDVTYASGVTDSNYPMTNVHYTYDRLGRMATLTDAAGTHTFGYSPSRLRPETEEITNTFYGTTVTLHHHYQEAPPYRFSGLSADVGGTEVYSTTYMYEDQKPSPANTGRLWRVTGPGLPDYGAEYCYVTGSDAAGEIQFKHDANTIIARTTRTYEPNRDLLGKVANTWQADNRNISTYDHFQYGSSTISADALGRRTGLTQTGEVFPSPVTKIFGYNDRNELTSAYTIETGTVLGYAYDSIGNRTNTSWWSETEPPYTMPPTTYVTNSLNQYRQINDNVAETPPYLGYDEDGNLTREAETGRLDVNCDGIADSRDTGIFFSLTPASPVTCKPAPCPAWYTQAYPWCDCYWADLNSDNCLSYADRTRYSQYLNSDYAVMLYTWDGENRLRAAANKRAWYGSPKEEYQYDALGRRIERKLFYWNGSSWSLINHQKYVWSGWKLLLELSVPTTGAPTVLRKHTWGLDLAGLNGSVNSLEGAGTIGGLLSVADAARTDDRIVYFYDANGNVTEVLNLKYIGGFTWDSARLLAHYEYDPYGNRTNAIPAGEYNQPWRFSTKQFSTNTGLGYWGYRYYSPRFGRWTSEDPIAERGGHNLYMSFANRPDARDALGMFIITDILNHNYGSPPQGRPEIWDYPLKDPPPIPGTDQIDCGNGPEYISRAKAEELLRATAAQRWQLDRACCGVCSMFQGKGALWPEFAPGTKCYLTEPAADRCCPDGSKPFVFAEQGQPYPYNEVVHRDPNTGCFPLPPPDASDGGAIHPRVPYDPEDPPFPYMCRTTPYNYVTVVTGKGGKKCYLWMNVGAGYEPQLFAISPVPCNDRKYPVEMWCRTCP